MVRLNGVEYEYRPGLLLAELIDVHNRSHARVAFDSCIVVVNSAVVPAPQAQRWSITDNENIYIVPILDGG